MNQRIEDLKARLRSATRNQWIAVGVVAFVLTAMIGGRLAARRSARAIASVGGKLVAYPADRADHLKILNAVQLADPDVALMVSRPATSLGGDLKKLGGTYHGELKSRISADVVGLRTVLKTEDSKTGVIATLTGEMSAGGTRRRFDVKGPIKIAPSIDQRVSYLMQVGSKAYWQLFYVSQTDQWIGNYYDRDSTGHYVNTGVAQLIR